jgi:PAS domain S-box-containing protein
MPLQERNIVSTDLFDMIRGIVLILDVRGRVTQCNPYFENLTGYASSEVIGEDWFETFIPQHDRVAIREFFAQVMSAGFNDGYSNSILTKGGEPLLIEWYSKTLVGADGQIIGMLCTGFDVTERTAMALELEKSKESAISATETKTRFLAATNHDLRQPLQSLGLYLAMLSRQPDPSKQEEVVYKMRQSLDTMGELLDALLNISKLDSGSVTADKVDIHIQELLDRIVTNNVQQAEKKGLKLECKSVDFVVHTDPSLLERLIENFVTNSIRYTEQGHVRISCVLDEHSVRVAVSDTGIGIPEDQIESVFEEYYQLDNQVRDRRKGLGLGLSIVKHISRILDHPLDVSSIPGEGSTFAVKVPFGQQVVRVKREVSRRIQLGDLEPIVLFVDDDPTIIDATTMFLNKIGVHVHSASSGAEAIALVEAGIRPDIIVSDYRLPEYNGLEVIRRVRKATVDNLPAILMTGDTSVKEIDNANLGNCTVLHKPVDTDVLISLISQLTA